MKKFVMGLIVGMLLVITFNVAAMSNIKLIIDGQEVETDVPPQIIDGRVMVPARFVAESLGATVEWDGEKMAVIVTPKTSATLDIPANDYSQHPDPDVGAEWVALRGVVNSEGWIVSGDFVYRNKSEQDDGISLFNWRDVGKIINAAIYVPRHVAEQY